MHEALSSRRIYCCQKKINKHCLSVLCAAAIISPIISSCGSSTPSTANLPPVDDSNRQTAAVSAPAHKGMSNGQKVVLLAGAAALYYMYKKNQESHQAGNSTEPQYYLSKNGRVYYREKGGRVHWVTPPQDGIQVPQSEASQYQQLQGYAGSTTGRDLSGMSQE